jgi:predicted RNA binding protein YcfA (HicA-like mRNA interferase family)
MPKLPVISGSEVVKALKRIGFEEVRQRGSHVMLRRGTVGTVVPLHRELKVGTLAGLLRQAEVSIDDFLSALR